ncbi:MAG: hypothetical protein PUH07_08440 [Methanobrevibacter smithii]|nr:hypothetical protein [Methanobrevibacter smithii]MDD7245116.1 hypothetical protein [Methanobrevibacter smithii]
MNLKEAYEKMREGKKVKRKGRSMCCFYDSKAGRICTGDGLAVTGIAFEAALADDWEVVVEKNKIKVLEPSLGDLYYYINSNGDIKFSYYNTRSIDKRCIGNFFKTDEEAHHMVEKLKVIKELKELSNIKFNMSDYLKNNGIYYIAYDFTQNRIVPLFDNISRNIPFNVYFSTKEDCEKAITKIGKERLERYYFDIED